MKKWLVRMPELWDSFYEVEAETAEEARSRVEFDGIEREELRRYVDSYDVGDATEIE